MSLAPFAVMTSLSHGARPARAAGAAALFVVVLASSPALAGWSPVAVGVDYDTFIRSGSRVHAIRIDLCAPGIFMRATAPGEGPRTTGSFGALVGATAAINGDWWAADGSNPALPPTTFPRGLAVGNGEHFAGTEDPSYYGFFAFGHDAAVHSIMEEAFGPPAPWMEQVVSGQPTLVWDGALRDNPNAHCGVRRARTAVGLGADGSTLYWAVVEEVAGSVGMTCNEMAALMRDLGAHSALNQDGGGSSTMWIEGRGTVNNPSDGSPRSVVTHWGVDATGSGPPRSCPTREIPTWDQGVRRPVSDADVWRFALSDLILLSDEAIALWPEGRPWPTTRRLVSADGDPAVYLVDDGLRRHVPSPYAMTTWRFPWDAIETADVSSLEAAPAIPDTPVLVVGSDFQVYVIDYAADPSPPGDPDAGPDLPGAPDAAAGAGNDDAGANGVGDGAGGVGGGCRAVADTRDGGWFSLFVAGALVELRRRWRPATARRRRCR